MNIAISPELEESRAREYPVDASLKGDNAFYLGHCTVVDHRPPYAMCMVNVTDRKDGRLDSRWAACSAAIGNKTCPAIKLRKEELAAGKALYYIPRALMRERAKEREEAANTRFGRLIEGGKRVVERVSRALRGEEQKKPETPKRRETDIKPIAPTDAFAEAISRAAAAETKKAEQPAPPKAESKPVSIVAKGGLMAFAKAKSTTEIRD